MDTTPEPPKPVEEFMRRAEAIASDALKFLAACFDQSAEIGWFSDLANGNTRYDYAGEEFRRFADFFTRQMRDALADDAWIAPMRTGLDVREPLFRG